MYGRGREDKKGQNSNLGISGQKLEYGQKLTCM